MGDLVGDFFGGDEFTNGDALGGFFSCAGFLVEDLMGCAGIEGGGGDFVDEDVVGGEFEGHELAEHAEPGFGDAVGGDVQVRGVGGPASGEDDAAGSFGGDEALGGGLGHVEGAV